MPPRSFRQPLSAGFRRPDLGVGHPLSPLLSLMADSPRGRARKPPTYEADAAERLNSIEPGYSRFWRCNARSAGLIPLIVCGRETCRRRKNGWVLCDSQGNEYNTSFSSNVDGRSSAIRAALTAVGDRPTIHVWRVGFQQAADFLRPLSRSDTGTRHAAPPRDGPLTLKIPMNQRTSSRRSTGLTVFRIVSLTCADQA
jgi:hypothetical protein